MEEKTITLADGTVIDGCGAGYADGDLWIYPEMTMKEAAGLFLEEEKTQTIVYSRGGEVITYIGFTDCIMMNVVPGGLRIMLTGTDTQIIHGDEQEEE